MIDRWGVIPAAEHLPLVQLHHPQMYSQTDLPPYKFKYCKIRRKETEYIIS